MTTDAEILPALGSACHRWRVTVDDYIRQLVREEVARQVRATPQRPPASLTSRRERALGGADQVARYLGLSRTEFYSRRKAGEGIGIRFPAPLGSSGRPGRKKRYLRELVDKWDAEMCSAEREGRLDPDSA